jgi:hypothetical protein
MDGYLNTSGHHAVHHSVTYCFHPHAHAHPSQVFLWPFSLDLQVSIECQDVFPELLCEFLEAVHG